MILILLSLGMIYTVILHYIYKHLHPIFCQVSLCKQLYFVMGFLMYFPPFKLYNILCYFAMYKHMYYVWLVRSQKQLDVGRKIIFSLKIIVLFSLRLEVKLLILSKEAITCTSLDLIDYFNSS